MDANESMRCGDLHRLGFHTPGPPNPTYPQAQSMTSSALSSRLPRMRKEWADQTCDCFKPRGLLPLGLWHALLPTRERVIRKGEVRVVFVIPCLAMPWGPMWKITRGMASQPEHACRLAEAGRGWPRLAEAIGRPELDRALAGRFKAGGRIGRRLWAAVFHVARHRASAPTACGGRGGCSTSSVFGCQAGRLRRVARRCLRGHRS